MKLLVQKLREGARLPFRASEWSAGADLYACLERAVTIEPGEILRVPTGIAVAPDRQDVMLCLFPRSGLASQFGITLANSVGVVDSDYRGEIEVALINLGQDPFLLEDGVRIAQLVAVPVLMPEISWADALDETKRGSMGFGGSGLK